jgi:hypothetical protein
MVMASEAGEDLLPPSSHRVERALDTNEAFFAAYNSVGAYLTSLAMELEGPLTEPLLRRAMAHLQERHPLLRARIVGDPSGPRWTTPPLPSAPELRVADGEEARSLERLAESELRRGYLPASEPLWRCVFAPSRGGEPHRLILSAHHSVADGMSGLVLITDLVATCAALAAGEKLSPYLPALPPLDDLLEPEPAWERLRRRIRQRWRGLGGLLLCAPEMLPLETAAPLESRRTRVLFRAVPRSTLDALRTRAREERTTVTGALAAAFLEATRATVGGLRKVPLNHLVSLRGSRVPGEQLGCFTSGILTTHSLGKDQPFWDVARKTTTRLRAALKRGEPLVPVRANRGWAHLARAEIERQVAEPGSTGREGALSLSSRGCWPDPSAGPFKVRSLFPATSNHTLGNGAQISCGTVGDTLFGTFMFVEPLFCEATGRAFADRVWAALEREALGHAGPTRTP